MILGAASECAVFRKEFTVVVCEGVAAYEATILLRTDYAFEGVMKCLQLRALCV